jgi:hypothetical protein
MDLLIQLLPLSENRHQAGFEISKISKRR